MREDEEERRRVADDREGRPPPPWMREAERTVVFDTGFGPQAVVCGTVATLRAMGTSGEVLLFLKSGEKVSIKCSFDLAMKALGLDAEAFLPDGSRWTPGVVTSSDAK